MPPPTGADTGHLAGLRLDVVDNIVGATASDAARNEIELKHVAGLPCDAVIRTGSIAADADGTDQLVVLVIECQAAAKYVHTANFSTDHRIVGLPVVGGVATVGHRNIDRVALLKSEKLSAG